MRWFTRLFGGGNTSKQVSAPQHAPQYVDQAFIERELQQAHLREEAMRIITDYAAVLETLGERTKSTGRFLHPESLLPYPKEVIRTAFGIILGAMEQDDLPHWHGIPKEMYLGAATALEENFAPDEEVPENPAQNIHAFYQWLKKIGAIPPLDRVKEDQRIRANPEAEHAMLEILGISKEIRDILINASIARAEERERTESSGGGKT